MMKSDIDSLIETHTRDFFHDASMVGLAIDFRVCLISIDIIHYRDAAEGDDEVLVLSHLLFRDVNNARIMGAFTSLKKDNEISSFEISGHEPVFRFEFQGIRGWEISFDAIGMDYAEEIILTWD